jgi:soluble lytic murein transglycosylase
MLRSVFARLATLSILGALVASCAAPGSADAASRRAVSRPVDASSIDEAFTQARQAAMQDNASAFEAAAARAADHPLAVYLEYWRLRLHLNDRKLEYGSGVDADAERFLAAQSGSLVGDLARRDWMLALGRRGEWAKLEALYDSWVLRDDNQVACYKLLARAQRGEAIADAAREQLAAVRDLGEGCGALLEQLARSGTFKRDDLWKRMLLALETNSPNSVRKIAPLAGLDAERVENALSRPARELAAPGAREYDVIALARIARDTPRMAVDRAGGGLTAADKAFVTALAAAASMRKLEPEALGWTREALAAPVTDETLVWMARAALRGQDWKTLLTVIGRMSPEGQRDPAWVYWQARALQATGRRDEGDALLRTIAGQFHFYGQLAAEDLGQLSATPPRAAAPTEAELAEAERNEGFARAMKFYALGLRFEGNREWNFQLRAMNDRQLLAAAEWACQRKVLDRCVNTADRTTAEHDFALRFISPFLEQLRPVARDAGLDPAWVYGLIRQESRFIMDARSSAGAQGLMQMMPATARWVARKLGVADFRVDQLNDLSTNLRFGTFYLKNVFDDLEGSPLLASAAYNAGPNRPRSWRATLPGAVEGALFAEIIPFNETRDYVKKVLSNATFYAALFTGQPQSLKQRLGQVVPKAAAASELP